MACQKEDDVSPADVDIGMMLRLFGKACYLIHERDGVKKRCMAIALAQTTFFPLPAAHPMERLVHLRV
jgi:hypothetical protein